MHTIYARRTAPDVYDVTYSDDKASDRMSEHLLASMLTEGHYARVIIDDAVEGGEIIVYRTNYNPERSLLLQGTAR